MLKKIKWDMLPMIMALALPTMLEQLMQTAVQYIDTAMVGSLGTEATAAVGATTTVNWLIGSTISALGVGFLAIISQSLGAKKHTLAVRTAAQAVFVTLVTGIFFTVLTLSLSPLVPKWMQVDESIQKQAASYFFILYLPMLPRTASIIFGSILRAVGDSKTPMRVGIIVNIINVNFDMKDAVISSDILKEYLAFLEYDSAKISGWSFKDYVFLNQDNNDGQLYININGKDVSYAFIMPDEPTYLNDIYEQSLK